MINSAQASIIAGIINILFVFIIHKYIKTKIKTGLIGIMTATAVWEICMGMELVYAYSENLQAAKIFSWIGGMFIMSTPGFLLIFITPFCNLGNSWRKFATIILLVCFSAGLLSPWGIDEYSLHEGRYLTKPGIIHEFHIYLAGFWIIFSFGLLIYNRLSGTNMTIANARQIDIFFIGLGLSCGGVILFTFFFHNMTLATVFPLLIPISAIIAVRYFRIIHIEKPKPEMPENILFSGPYKKYKSLAFYDLGMNVDVYPLRKFTNEQQKLITEKKILFPEDGLDKLPIDQAMAVTVVNSELVLVVQSKYDGIVHVKDIKKLSHLGAIL